MHVTCETLRLPVENKDWRHDNLETHAASLSAERTELDDSGPVTSNCVLKNKGRVHDVVDIWIIVCLDVLHGID